MARLEKSKIRLEKEKGCTNQTSFVSDPYSIGACMDALDSWRGLSKMIT